MPDQTEKLKFDRRLARRPGWTSPEEYQAHVEALPDAADKATTAEDESQEG